MEITDTYFARNRTAWRKWLGKNHESKKELWLIFYKTHTGQPCLSYNDAVEEALCFGWIDSTIKSIDDEKYARKFTPRNPGSQWSELNKQRVSRMIEEKKMMPAGMQVLQGIDLSITGKIILKELAIPGYITEALKSNGTAFRYFSGLAPSFKKQYVGWIDSAKKEETRQKRLLECLTLLEQGKKLPMK